MDFRKAFEHYGMVSQRQLARDSGVNEAVINKLYHGKESVNFVSLIKIADALGVSCWQLIREAGKQTEKGK